MGLDPVARRSLVESMIYLTRRSDRTIFFSSHQLPDVERVADYIAVLDHSVLRACCPLETFRNSVQAGAAPLPGRATCPCRKSPACCRPFRSEGELRVTCVHYNGATEAAAAGAGARHRWKHCPSDWKTRSSATWGTGAKSRSSCPKRRHNHESTRAKRNAGECEGGGAGAGHPHADAPAAVSGLRRVAREHVAAAGGPEHSVEHGLVLRHLRRSCWAGCKSTTSGARTCGPS